MDDVIAPRRNNEPLDLGSKFLIDLDDISNNGADFTIEQLIAALESTTTLTYLIVSFRFFKSTSENSRRFVEPLCRCIANLRRHNKDNLLRRLAIICVNNKVKGVDQFLVAAKQLGIRNLFILDAWLPIQSLVEFCRGNAHLKTLAIARSSFLDEEFSVSPQDSSFILALDELLLDEVGFRNAAVASKCSIFLSHVTYSTLDLGRIDTAGKNGKEKKIARMRIVSELIQPSVERLTLSDGCRIETMDAIQACTTVTQITPSENSPPIRFRREDLQQKLQAIARRNRELARFAANPPTYPGIDFLALMNQFDNNPTGRYMLVCCFPGIPSFFKIKSSNSTNETVENQCIIHPE